MDKDDIAVLIARLSAQQVLPRADALVRRAITDAAFHDALQERLAACGLEFHDNPYADHVALRLKREFEAPVMGGESSWLSNNLGLPRDAVALLVVLWALLILPKRQRQIERKQKELPANQGEMFAQERPLPDAAAVGVSVATTALFTDFADRLGGRTKLQANLGLLKRLGFVEETRKGELVEGPLLDVVLDYNRMAGRILDGALTDLLAQGAAAAPEDH
jgi:hypothetical protein